MSFDRKRDRLALHPLSMPNVVRGARITSRLGVALLPLFRKRVSELKAGHLSSTPTLLEDVLLAGLVRSHLQRGTLGELTALSDWFWSNSPAVQFHEFAERRFERFFLEHHVEIVAPIQAAIAARPGAFSTVCEIGCGSGRVLQYLAGALPDVPRFVGLDLSQEQVARNRARYAGQRTEFEAGDGLAWIEQHGSAGWVYMTYGGVLEFFSRQKVVALCSAIASKLAPSLLAIVEPLSDEQTLGTDSDSAPFGAENTFSHDYVSIVQAAGLQIVYRSEQRFDNQRWLLLVASSANETSSNLAGRSA